VTPVPTRGNHRCAETSEILGSRQARCLARGLLLPEYMSRRLRLEGRLDLVMVTLLCFLMTGCLAALRREPEPDVKRVVYLGIEKATPAMEQAVAQRVDPGYERVSAEEYRETARELQAETMTDLDVARVASALEVDVIIHGRYVRKNNRRGHVEVLMRTAATGAIVGEYVVPVRRGAMTKRGERKLDKQLRAELQALLGPPVPAPASPDEAVASAEATPDETAGAPESVVEENARAQPAAAQAAPKPAPAQAAAKPAPTAKAAPAAAPTAKASDKQAPRVSEKPATGAGAVVRSQPTAPAPVLREDANGQVIDDDQPPGM
jgi:hypothetical protein